MKSDLQHRDAKAWLVTPDPCARCRARCEWLLALLILFCVGHASAQASARDSSFQRGSSAPNAQSGPGQPSEDEFNTGGMRHRLELARSADRLRRMQDDVNRLLELSRAVQASASEHDDLSAADRKRLDDIAKLAKDVRERMKQ